MKRALILLFLIVILKSGFSQTAGNPYGELLGQTGDGSVKAYKPYCKDGGYTFIYGNGHRYDTLRFENGSVSITSCTIRVLKQDSKGVSVLMVSCSGSSNTSVNNDVDEEDHTMNEIWNLRKRRKIFDAKSQCLHETIRHMDVEPNPEPDEDDTVEPGANPPRFKERPDTTRQQDCMYSYDLRVDREGHVIIENLTRYNRLATKAEIDENEATTKTELNPDDCDYCHPDHEPDIYIFKHGRYTKQKMKK